MLKPLNVRKLGFIETPLNPMTQIGGVQALAGKLVSGAHTRKDQLWLPTRSCIWGSCARKTALREDPEQINGENTHTHAPTHTHTHTPSPLEPNHCVLTLT